MNKSKYLSILNEIKEQGGSELGDNPNENVLIIDGLNTFIRVFSVIPTTNDDGTHIGGIVGFLKSIGYTINMFRPTRCIIVFDGKGGSSRRRKLYPEYKAKRKTNIRLNRAYGFDNIEHERENMIRQIRRTIDYLEYLPITLLSIDNVEADDIIAYASKQVLTDSKVTIMSSDKDFLQLVDDRISVWSPTKKKLYKKGGKSAFGMLSVKAGVDNNPNPTAADRIVGAKKNKKKMGMGGKKMMKYKKGGMKEENKMMYGGKKKMMKKGGKKMMMGGKKKMMDGGMMKKYQSGGFLEPGIPNIDDL